MSPTSFTLSWPKPSLASFFSPSSPTTLRTPSKSSRPLRRSSSSSSTPYRPSNPLPFISVLPPRLRRICTRPLLWLRRRLVRVRRSRLLICCLLLYIIKLLFSFLLSSSRASRVPMTDEAVTKSTMGPLDKFDDRDYSQPFKRLARYPTARRPYYLSWEYESMSRASTTQMTWQLGARMHDHVSLYKPMCVDTHTGRSFLISGDSICAGYNRSMPYFQRHCDEVMQAAQESHLIRLSKRQLPPSWLEQNSGNIRWVKGLTVLQQFDKSCGNIAHFMGRALFLHHVLSNLEAYSTPPRNPANVILLASEDLMKRFRRPADYNWYHYRMLSAMLSPINVTFDATFQDFLDRDAEDRPLGSSPIVHVIENLTVLQPDEDENIHANNGSNSDNNNDTEQMADQQKQALADMMNLINQGDMNNNANNDDAGDTEADTDKDTDTDADTDTDINVNQAQQQHNDVADPDANAKPQRPPGADFDPEPNYNDPAALEGVDDAIEVMEAKEVGGGTSRYVCFKRVVIPSFLRGRFFISDAEYPSTKPSILSVLSEAPRVPRDSIRLRGRLNAFHDANIGFRSRKKIIMLFDRSGSRRVFDKNGHKAVLTLLRRVAASRGYKVAVRDFSNTPFDEQYDEVRQVAVGIGIHGANLVNALFMPPLSALIEIFPHKFNHVMYVDGGNAGLKYFRYEMKTGDAYSKVGEYRSVQDCILRDVACKVYYRDSMLKMTEEDLDGISDVLHEAISWSDQLP